MKNYVQPGGVVTLTAAADVVAGDVVKIGDLAGVVTYDAKSGADMEVCVEGAFDVAKNAPADVFAAGDAAYVTGSKIAKTGTGKVGTVIQASAANHATVRVLFNTGVR